MLPADVYARFKRATGPRGALHLRHRRARHAGRARRARSGHAGRGILRGAARDPGADLPRLRAVLGLVRPLLVAAEPRADPAFRRRAGGQRLHRGADRDAGLFGRRRPLPARPLHRRHLPALRLPEGARRPVRQLRPAAGPDRPDRAHSAISGSSNLEVRETRHLFLQAAQAGRPGRGLDRTRARTGRCFASSIA